MPKPRPEFRRLLVALLGRTPQVLTETLFVFQCRGVYRNFGNIR
jgi:hypothetical protein